MARRLAFVLVIACTLFGAAGTAQAQILSQANVSADADGDNEVDIAINPTNPKNLVAAWNDYGPGFSCGLGYSTDGGKHWTTSWLRGVTPDGGNPLYDFGAGDPSVGFLGDGTAILACNAWSSQKSQPTALFMSRSTDGGATWQAPQLVSAGGTYGDYRDHPMMTIDRYRNRVLVAYSVFNGNLHARSYALVSSDAGRTYQGPYEIAADYKAEPVVRFDVSLAGAPDGTIYAVDGTWRDPQEWSEQAVVVSQLRPGETSFTRSVKVRDLVPVPMNLPGALWRSSMQPSIGVEGDGTVDVLISDARTGNLDPYLARSTDHGVTFPAARQADLTSDVRDQVMPWLSVRPSGRVDVVGYDYDRSTALLSAWYGRVPAGGTAMTRTVLATGIDGNVQPPGSAPFIGDYLGIDSLDDRVAVSWTGNGPASLDVFSAVLRP